MGQHTHSNREVRKRKYAEQFARTAANKKRKAEKRLKKLEERKNEKSKMGKSNRRTSR